MPPFRLAGKRALVTGGTKGLGAAIVRSLAMRPLLTDNVRAVEAQMGTYVREHGSPALSRDLIDSAYVARDLRSTPRESSCTASRETKGGFHSHWPPSTTSVSPLT